MAVEPGSIVVRRPDGRKVTVAWNARLDPSVRRGDALVLETSPSGEAIALSRVEPGRTVAGRVRSLNPRRKELTVETAEGAIRLQVQAGSVLFKDNRPANWLELHQGEAVAAMGQARADGIVATALFDALSYVVRELESTHGGLLARGPVSEVSPRSRTEGTLTIGTASLRYDGNTRWQLGARFQQPQDFEGVEALAFGPPGQARLVLSRRAVPFMFETLVGR